MFNSKKIKKFIKYYFFGESLKEMEMNRILDKISNKKKLEDKEIEFLNLYQQTSDDDLRDFVYLSKNSTFSKVSQLIENGKKVICDLHDKDGRIGLQIIGLENDFEKERCVLNLKGGETYFLYDKFLYNIIYNTKKGEYSLQEQDEYYEKIEAKNGED
jgi:hypothetical protein